MAEAELLRAAASKAEARLDALEAVFKERDEVRRESVVLLLSVFNFDDQSDLLCL